MRVYGVMVLVFLVGCGSDPEPRTEVTSDAGVDVKNVGNSGTGGSNQAGEGGSDTSTGTGGGSGSTGSAGSGGNAGEPSGGTGGDSGSGNTGGTSGSGGTGGASGSGGTGGTSGDGGTSGSGGTDGSSGSGGVGGQGCSQDSDCTGHTLSTCIPSSGECVECTEDADCGQDPNGEPYVCDSNNTCTDSTGTGGSSGSGGTGGDSGSGGTGGDSGTGGTSGSGGTGGDSGSGGTSGSGGDSGSGGSSGSGGGFVEPDFIQISTGYSHSCAIDSTGDVWCWGQIEVESESYPRDGIASRVSGVSDAVDISSGERHTCVIVSDGRVKCWGDNRQFQSSGQYPSGVAETPVFVEGVENAVDVIAGVRYTCAIIENGTVMCWGSNPILDTHEPSPIEGIEEAKEIDASPGRGSGETFTMNPIALSGPFFTDDGTEHVRVSSWDWSEHNCDGVNTCSYDYLTWDQSHVFMEDVEVSGSNMICGVERNRTQIDQGFLSGRVECWEEVEGNHEEYDDMRWNSIHVESNETVFRIAAGWDHFCALTYEGSVHCLGSNRSGQVGNGEISDSWVHDSYKVLEDAVSIDAAYNHTCAVLENGKAKCWGNPSGGKLGNSDINGGNPENPDSDPAGVDYYPTPQDVIFENDPDVY